MAAIYDGYLWLEGQEEPRAVRGIVADNRDQAVFRSLVALRRRARGKELPTLLQKLHHYLHGYAPCPQGLTLQVIKRIDRPERGCVVIGG